MLGRLAWILVLSLGVGALAQGQRLVLEFWHSHEGNVGEALEALVREYNARQTRVFVKSTYVGSYTDGLSKFVAALRAGRGYPHLMQAVDYGARLMADSNAIVPLEDLARQEGYDLERLLPLARMRYTIDGKMFGIPFNTSNPLLFFNWDAFQEAGIPYRPSWTLGDLEEAARRLTKRDSQGRVLRYGLSVPIGSFFLEHFTFNSGYYWCNNENGRLARATAVNLDNEAVVAFLETFARLVREGVAVNTGRNTADSQSLFAQGRVAIAAYSTAHLTRVMAQVGNRFRVRTAFYPYLRERNGVTVSGAGLYILKGFSPEETKAAWDFVRYLIDPKTQAKWHLATGYFPVTRGAVEQPEVREAHVREPNYTTALQQFLTSKPNNISAGCVMGAYPEVRRHVENAWEQILQGRPVREALAEAKRRADAVVEEYNRSVATQR